MDLPPENFKSPIQETQWAKMVNKVVEVELAELRLHVVEMMDLANPPMQVSPKDEEENASFQEEADRERSLDEVEEMVEETSTRPVHLEKYSQS